MSSARRAPRGTFASPLRTCFTAALSGNSRGATVPVRGTGRAADDRVEWRGWAGFAAVARGGRRSADRVGGAVRIRPGVGREEPTPAGGRSGGDLGGAGD